MEKIKYSFIIPVKAVNDYIRESVPKILEIPRDDFEIIIYPDFKEETAESWPKTRIIPSPSGPSPKRSLAMRDALGEFLIFVDDDAYPEKEILDFLDEDFSDASVAAVGGPALTPRNDTFLQKVSGAVYLSFLGGNFPERYFPIGEKRFVTDWPTVNLSVRKDVFQKVGGFDCNFWPGEDTKFCLDIVKKFKERNKILYDPRILVWHHRREGLLRHLKQVGGYGLHRGFFAKKYPETSFQFNYFVPSVFFLFAVFGWLSFFLTPLFGKIYVLGWLVYALALAKVFYDILRRQREFTVAAYSLVYVFFTHLVYGARFIQGFAFTKELRSKLR